jgi:cell division protein FtsL
MTPPAAAAAETVPHSRAGTRPRPRAAPQRPRRVSGPARRPARAGQPALRAERGLELGVVGVVQRLCQQRTLDRLIRGRLWIALIAFALIGIVLLQLLALQLNARIGRALVHEARLQRENATLSIEGSELAAGERVQSQAVHMGMELVPIGALRFLTSDPRADVALAAAALSTPVQSASTPASSPAAGASAGAAGASAGASGSSAEQSPADGSGGSG